MTDLSSLTSKQWNDIDPGVREVVGILRMHGFDTIDSGDGISKKENGWDDGEYLDYPHIFISVEPKKLIEETDRLFWLLYRKYNIYCAAQGPEGSEGPFIQATYDPAKSTATAIMLANVTKETFEKAGLIFSRSSIV